MGKKNRLENNNYDLQNLKSLASYLERVRTPLEEGNIPKIKVDLEGLEKTIKALPRKERETLEKFWGLNPGMINHSQNIKGLGAVAYGNMFEEVKRILKKIISLEYLRNYDPNASQLVENIAKKVDKGGLEISDLDTVKYLIVLTIMLDNGPQMPFDEEEKIDCELDDTASFDDYAMACEIWRILKDRAPDKSINLKLLIEAIEMFDIPDVVAIKKFANLPINRVDEKDFEDESKLETLHDIRAFKERIFPYGSWNITLELIIGKEINLEPFSNALDLFRQDWANMLKFKTERTRTIVTSEGERKLTIYEIGGLEFTDPYEVMFLYVARNIIL